MATRGRRAANPPAPDLANVVADLQRQLQEQQQETTRLREQLTRLNQRPQVNEVPPVPNVPPVVQPEVPVAPAEVPMQPQPIREDMLYERFRRMKAPEFEGPTDPIAADNWLIDIQEIGRASCRERVSSPV